MKNRSVSFRKYMAKRGHIILRTYGKSVGLDNADDSQSALGDLLADLRHAAAMAKLDFDSALRISESHYEEECEGPYNREQL